MNEWLGVIERLPHKHLTWGNDNVRLGNTFFLLTADGTRMQSFLREKNHVAISSLLKAPP
jgi:hypothetical protein